MPPSAASGQNETDGNVGRLDFLRVPAQSGQYQMSDSQHYVAEAITAGTLTIQALTNGYVTTRALGTALNSSATITARRKTSPIA
jgi:hypothetical protein